MCIFTIGLGCLTWMGALLVRRIVCVLKRHWGSEFRCDDTWFNRIGRDDVVGT